MSVKLEIEFVEAKSLITEPVTKFGGQPVWIESPQWPVSRETVKPMQFIGQVKIDSALFGECPAKMAYLFVTDDSDSPGMYETWDPDGGENAVILQPGNATVKTEPLKEGPTLYRMVEKGLFKKKRVAEPCEYAVRLSPMLEPDFIPESMKDEIGEDVYEDYYMKIQGNKLGGAPCFVQSDELPFPQGWKLLLQLDSTELPFWMNMGDAGMGHVFMHAAGTEAKFLWQCQ